MMSKALLGQRVLQSSFTVVNLRDSFFLWEKKPAIEILWRKMKYEWLP